MKNEKDKRIGYLFTEKSKREGWAMVVSSYTPFAKKKYHFVSQLNVCYIDTVNSWAVDTLRLIGGNIPESKTNKHVETYNDIVVNCFPNAIPAFFFPSALEKSYKFWQSLLDEFIEDMTWHFELMGFKEIERTHI